MKTPAIPDGHPQRSVKKQIFLSVMVLLLLLSATLLVIMYGKGYRIFVQQGEPKVTKTGILNLTSSPTGAQVYVNDHPTTTTNGSINLTPGKYKIKIAKEGYYDWQKDFDIKREVVSDAEATFFPKAPTLQSISTFGIQSVFIDPTGTKLAFNIASNSARKNGIYIFDMTARNFPVLAGQSSATQIADDTGVDQFSKAKLNWSPDGKQIMATVAGPTGNTYYLLNTDGLNQTPQDITAIYTATLEDWKLQRDDKEAARLKSLKPNVQTFAKDNFRILSWTADDNKILYQASHSAEMPVFKKPRLIGNNHLYERRDLKEGAIYSYNIKEDYNSRIIDTIDTLCTMYDPECSCSEPDSQEKCTVPFTWFPDSTHLLYVHEQKIDVVEDDGSNLTTLYAGPFVDNYVFPWPDGSKLVILTNFNNANVPPTLYSIGLK